MQFALAVVRAGFRSRAFHGVIALGVALIGVAFLAASFSPRQPQIVALDVGLSGIRFALILLALFWVQDFLTKEVERKTVLYSLSYPVSRMAYLFGRLAGILCLLGLAALLLGLLLLLAVISAGKGYDAAYSPALGLPYWATVFGLWLGVCVVTTFAFMLAALSTVSFLPLALGAAFAIAAQSLGAVADYLASGADGQEQLVARYAPIIDTVRWVLPDLSRLDWRTWAMYGIGPSASEVGYSLMMAGAYCVVLFYLSVLAFAKRDFN